MAFPTWLPKVRYHREHFNKRTRLCYHQAPPLVRVVVHVGGCRASKAPPQTQPFIASGNLSCNASTKTEWPCPPALSLDHTPGRESAKYPGGTLERTH